MTLTSPIPRSILLVAVALLIVAAAFGAMSTSTYTQPLPEADSAIALHGVNYYEPVRYSSPYHGVGLVLTAIGVTAVVFGGVLMAARPLVGGLVLTGSSVLAIFGIWVAYSPKALQGGAMGLSLAINAVILAAILEFTHNGDNKTLITRRTIQTAAVVASVLIQALLAANLFQDYSTY